MTAVLRLLALAFALATSLALNAGIALAQTGPAPATAGNSAKIIAALREIARTPEGAAKVRNFIGRLPDVKEETKIILLNHILYGAPLPGSGFEQGTPSSQSQSGVPPQSRFLNQPAPSGDQRAAPDWTVTSCEKDVWTDVETCELRYDTSRVVGVGGGFDDEWQAADVGLMMITVRVRDRDQPPTVRISSNNDSLPLAAHRASIRVGTGEVHSTTCPMADCEFGPAASYGIVSEMLRNSELVMRVEQRGRCEWKYFDNPESLVILPEMEPQQECKVDKFDAAVPLAGFQRAFAEVENR